jgi:hypothetical protein
MLSQWQRYLRPHPRSIDVIAALVPVLTLAGSSCLRPASPS